MHRSFSMLALATAVTASIATSSSEPIWSDTVETEYTFEVSEGPEYEVEWRAILDDVAYDQWFDDELRVTVDLDSAGDSMVELRFTVDGNTQVRMVDIGFAQTRTVTFDHQQLREDALAVEWDSYETNLLLTAQVEGDDATVNVQATWNYEGDHTHGTPALSMTL